MPTEDGLCLFGNIADNYDSSRFQTSGRVKESEALTLVHRGLLFRGGLSRQTDITAS